jgi:hypothetical protein
VTALAGIFLAAFGALGAWFLSRRFPHAHFLRFGYVLMSSGGGLFVVWSFAKVLPVGVSAAVVMATGAVVGMVGALRRELRTTL